MSTRSGTPPTGPRQRGAPTARVGRGITKRRAGPLRIDHDGDVEMGSSNGIAGRGRGANRRAPYNRGNTTSHAGRDSLQSRAPQGVFGAAQQRAIIQNIASGNANIRGTKARGLFQKSPARGGARTQKQENNLDEIKILGLKDSKAASNADGGLESLRGFLERKSAARIIKVCPTQPTLTIKSVSFSTVCSRHSQSSGRRPMMMFRLRSSSEGS
jgi:nuclear RNA export factor